jgi:hypothetical protein
VIFIIGARDRVSRRETGGFHCPRCDTERRYERTVIVRVGHLFFVPLVKLGSSGEFVECLACRSRYDVGVLGAAR